MQKLLKEGASDVVVSRAEGGAIAIAGRPAPARPPGPVMTAIDGSGAGDSMTAALAFAQASGLAPEETLKLAVAAGAMNVTRHGLGSGDADGDRATGRERRDRGDRSGREMRILVTNDDGIESPGLHALALALHEREHEVLVVAPSQDMSGVGAAIGRIRGDQRIEAVPASIPGAPDVTAFSLDGPPGLAVMAGCLGAFGEPPDLVVTGVNAGPNLGHACLHSGTVGAALTAATFGISALATSVDVSDPMQLADGLQRHRRAAAPARPAARGDGAQPQRPRAAGRRAPRPALGDARSLRARARRAGLDRRPLAADGVPRDRGRPRPHAATRPCSSAATRR